MAEPVVIRQYQSDDQEAVLALVERHFEGIRPGDGVYSDDDLRHVDQVYLDGRGEFLVGVTAGEVVSVGGVRFRDAKTAELARMRTHPTVQRRGYGRVLLRHLERRASDLGYRRLWLVTGVHLQTGGYRHADVDAVCLEKLL